MQFLRPFLFVLVAIISLLFKKHNMKGISIVQNMRQDNVVLRVKYTCLLILFLHLECLAQAWYITHATQLNLGYLQEKYVFVFWQKRFSYFVFPWRYQSCVAAKGVQRFSACGSAARLFYFWRGFYAGL